MPKAILLFTWVIFQAHFLHAQSDSTKIDELLQAYIKRGEFSGTALVAHKGQILLERGYGPGNDVSTIYQTASITKTFTAVLVLKLAALRQLSLQDKLTKYYPDYPHGDSITIEQLLTHTSGIYNYTRDQHFMESSAGKPASEATILALFKDKPLDFTPGSRHQYSNSGYMLLGYIIQQVTGLSYQEAMRKYIFTPLKMEHSGFDFIHLNSRQKATGYYADSSKAYSQPAPIIDSSVTFAAGSIYSTTGDLYRWHEGLQHHAIVGPSWLDKAYTPFLQHYGYGWQSDSLYGRRVVSHSGGLWGFRSNLMRVPADDICIVLLSNTETPALEKIASKILAILYHQPYQLPAKRTPIQLSPDVLNRYTGSYKLVGKELIVHVTLEDGALIARPENGPVSVMVPEDETHFFLREDEDFEVTFLIDGNGRVTGQRIRNGDRTGVSEKIR